MNQLNEQLADREVLLQKKAEIQVEINNYPGPIAGCDQQFNYLLEQRADIRKRLYELEQQRSKKGGVDR